MPMWPCDFEGCPRPAVRTFGDCILCNRHLCSVHLQPAFHSCPKWEEADIYDPAARAAEARELTELFGKINVAALAARASSLRGGIPCSIPPLQYDVSTRSSVMGGMNYHIELTFDDGIQWIARIRRSNATSPPAALRDYIIQSEVATLKFLEPVGLPSPRVFDFALENANNPVGVGYILMEKLAGKSLRWSLATQQQKKTVMNQLADVFIELHKYPFDLLGSLDRPGDAHIGAFARESLTAFAQSEMRPIGPLSSSEQYHDSSLQLILDLILRGEMYSQHAVDAYLIHRFLVDLIPLVSPSPSPSSPSMQNGRKYYLKHADDKGDHILVDDDFNITGIIDWEWAQTAPPAHAFNSPIGLLPVASFYDGVNDLGDDEIVFARLLEEKGRQDLAAFVWNGRVQHRFSFCCGYDLADWRGFLGLFQGLRNAVKVDEGLDWDEWKAVALHRYKEDVGLQLLLSRREVTASGP
ncbi:uncharacterized protein E0L32_010697 [Thyridium curvatum]|uniref:Aminoglycoside phosphotransferase domain-containing protein n=1 Tax=Thyridium curvatum TaxID=1093900 RepID=A0A507ARV1_9PEZI|nr:uncharacterized protein E0L32_010697 [Thyridium curvatum]TPX07598.1 hypothetical protein E0L32_010697 [Thyridium curvatum]